MQTRLYHILITFWRMAAVAVAIIMMPSCTQRVENAVSVDEWPKIFPDYADVTIPAEIAPLNFCYAGGEFECMDVVVKGSKGGEMHTQGDYADFDIDDWHALTEANRGGQLTVTVSVKHEGQWTQFRDFTIHVSTSPLEEWGLTYRRVAPGYETYSHMGIYQRCLSNFSEYAIIDNTEVPGMCVNCHTSNRMDPSQMVFHVRGEHGATMIRHDGKTEWLAAKNDLLGGSMVYPYWHPSGNYCAFSTNQTRQGFHVVHDERIEVFDLSSDIFVYHPETHEIISDSLIMTKDWSENCPVFSPDGRTLYFMTCRQQDYPAHFKQERYNLCSISFDPEKGTFGDHVDTLFNASAMEKSLTWPRPSYDGKYMLFTLIDYGYFSVWHKEADQWMLNLETGETWPLEKANSPQSDSYHNWSGNSRWIVFTSRRGGGLYSRLYLAGIDDKGHATKAFLLPQRNPWAYYDETLYSFNTPDFTRTKVEFDHRGAAKAIMSDQRVNTQVRP